MSVPVASGDAFGSSRRRGNLAGVPPFLVLFQTLTAPRRTLFNPASMCVLESLLRYVSGLECFLRSRAASNRPRPKPEHEDEHDYDFALPKKLSDKGLFFQELADRGVDLVTTEIIQLHVLHHFAAVITGGADRERADDSLLHSVAAI